MRARSVGTVLVTHGNGVLAGIFTGRDLPLVLAENR
jgi:hypothetical protein